MRYHVIDYWRTPASAYPRQQIGAWSISSRQMQPGLYPMQGEQGYFYLPQPIELTVLKEGEKVWFTDEPRQMYALAEIGLFRARGHVIIGGLGLGLVHHFLKANPNVRDVVTIEQAAEQRVLVWPYVQHGGLIIDDFYRRVKRIAEQGYAFDTIITDFIFGYQSDATWSELEATRKFCRRYFPDAQFLEHGYQARMDAEMVEAAIPPSDLVPAGTMFDQVRIVR